MKPRPTSTIAAAACAALALSVFAAPATAQTIAATGAWSRPVAPGLSTAVAYLTLRNHGSSPDRLVGASTPVATRTSVHRSMDMNGMMSMSPVTGGLALPPGGVATLAPGGYHLMLEGLKAGLKSGERYPLTLKFAHAAPLTVDVAVQANPPAAVR